MNTVTFSLTLTYCELDSAATTDVIVSKYEEDMEEQRIQRAFNRIINNMCVQKCTQAKMCQLWNIFVYHRV